MLNSEKAPCSMRLRLNEVVTPTGLGDLGSTGLPRGSLICRRRFAMWIAGRRPPGRGVCSVLPAAVKTKPTPQSSASRAPNGGPSKRKAFWITGPS